MCGIIGSVITVVVGVILVIGSCVISFIAIPHFIQNIIISETVLYEDTIQLERFREIPFPLNFTVRLFNLTNSEEFLNGAIPIVEEIGPYIYTLQQSRVIVDMDEDTVTYHRREHFEFNAEASFPHTEDDLITIVNVPYHVIIQIADLFYSNLASVLSLAMNGIFAEHNSPVATFRVQDLLFNGVPLCKNPGLIAGVACALIRSIGATAQNLEEMEDGSLIFSVLAYKQDTLSKEFKVHRGINDHQDLGRIITFNQSSHFTYWPNDLVVGDEGEVEQLSVCNMINGTDSGIFAPFVNKNEHLYAINTDICRSLEIRYESDSEYEDIPTLRYAANEWFLDDDDGCFCLNVTRGINRDNGCLPKGATELYSCVGAILILSYPHFLFADDVYREGVIGLSPDEERHKIFIDIEPNTGTPLRGFKRAQFNVVSRPVSGISSTANLRTTVVPFIWIEEGVSLPDEFVDEFKTRLLARDRKSVV